MRAPVGGLFRHVRDLAQEQARRGHAVGLVCDSATGGAMARDALGALEMDCALGVTRIAMGRLPGISDLSVIARVSRIAERSAAQILHGHGAKGGAYARFARLTGAHGPVHRFYTPHGGSLHYSPRSPAGMVFLAVERILLKRTDGLIFESAFGRDVYAAKVAEPTCPARVIHNGVRRDEFKPVAPFPHAADILFIGEMRALKGVFTLLGAIAKLSAADEHVTAVLVGDGAQRARLQAEAARLGLGQKIAFRPAMPAREAFSLGHLLVLPSLAESLPYVVLEAAAAGVPLIATNVGGISEIFGPLCDALVPPGDAEALAEAIRAARAHPAGLAKRTKSLRARVRKDFTVAGMSESILDFYRAVAAVGGV
jgi:glycosyltransferase involved in cell wall biosynthesis